MKTINTYLIEKLRLPKNTTSNSNFGCKWENFDMPYASDEMDIYKERTWKTWKLPLTTYIIYNDKYRGDHPHFSDVGDFCCGVEFNQVDYEDFNPDKDILFASNDLQETLEWMFDYIEIPYPPKDEEDFIEWEDKYADPYDNYYNGKKQICDNVSILGKIYIGEDSWYDKFTPFTNYKKDFYDTIEDYNFNVIDDK